MKPLLVTLLACAVIAGVASAGEDPPAGAPSQAGAEAADQSATTGDQTEPPPPEPAAPATLEDLRALIEEQQRLLDSQQEKLADQERLLEEQKGDLDARRKEIEALRLLIESLTRRLDELQGEMPKYVTQEAIEARLKTVEQQANKSPELPPDVVSAGDFPGSIRIPGTDAAIKFGGQVRVALVATLDPLGSKDRFLTNSIPVDPTPTPDDGKQTNINANTSRFNFEARTPTGGGQMRAFIEGDFFGPGNSFRLRHAYGQFHGFLFGQTWSTFSDPSAKHEDLDFEGVSSENVVRQPQMRYTWLPRPDRSIAVAIETPLVSVTNGTGSDVIPDLVGRYIWRFKETGHLQAAAVLRQIRASFDADPDDFVTETGWGIGLSGVIPFHHFNLTDRFIFQLNGGYGVGRYINDLSSLGGQDGAFDTATGDFEVLPAFGWFLTYEHMWKRWERVRDTNLRSSVIWSFVNVNNAPFQPGDSYHQTQRLVANVIFSPIRRIDVGLEYLYGSRTNKDGEEGSARQLQLVALFHF